MECDGLSDRLWIILLWCMAQIEKVLAMLKIQVEAVNEDDEKYGWTDDEIYR